MSAYSPGPWEALLLDLPIAEIPKYVERCLSASVSNDFYFVGSGVNQKRVDVAHVGNGPHGRANALLIAAAPDLLEALIEERRIRLLGQQPDVHWEGLRYDRRACHAATDAAIAKATQDFSDAYQGAREDLAIWKKRALEGEELNRKFIREINGPTFMGEPSVKKTHCVDGACSQCAKATGEAQ